MKQNNNHQNGTALTAESLRIGYVDQVVIQNLGVTIQEGQITALVGPNGSGKSTLLKTLARLIKPMNGAVYLDGRAISQLPTAEVARRLAILPQGPSAPPTLTVSELVEQGRFPHADRFVCCAVRIIRRLTRHSC